MECVTEVHELAGYSLGAVWNGAQELCCTLAVAPATRGLHCRPHADVGFITRTLNTSVTVVVLLLFCCWFVCFSLSLSFLLPPVPSLFYRGKKWKRDKNKNPQQKPTGTLRFVVFDLSNPLLSLSLPPSLSPLLVFLLTFDFSSI